MNRETLVVVALGLGIARPGASQLSDLTLQRLYGAAAAASHPIELSVNEGCANTYQAGQNMEITVRSPLNGYLYLFYFRADGEVTMMLFPCRHFWGNFPVTVRADSPLTLPPEGARIGLAIGPPLGRETLFAMVVPIEQMDLVTYFRAYDTHQFGYRTGDQEGFALFLSRKIGDLQGRGVPCAASLCVFFTVPSTEATPSLPGGGCVVGSEFRCIAGTPPAGCLSADASFITVPREQLPDTFGPGDDAVILGVGHYMGTVGEGDWQDWYRIRALHGQGFVVWFDPGNLVVDLYLLHDPCGDVLTECLAVRSATLILIPCYAGVECPGLTECFRSGECHFYIRIVWRGGEGDYRLSLLQGQPEVPRP